MCISWKLFWKSLRIILCSTYSAAVELNEVLANCASLITCCYYYNIPGVKTVSYQLTFCQHVPSKFDFKKISSIFDFPNFRASSAKLQGSSQGYCKDGCSSGKQLIHLSSSTWQASNHHLSPCSGTMTSLSLFLCIAGMIYCLFILYLSTFSSSSISTDVLICTGIQCLYAHMHTWNHMENEYAYVLINALTSYLLSQGHFHS